MLKPTTFEENLAVINQELKKRRSRWTLTAIPSLSWEDVEQIIRTHIWQKWHLYKQELPFLPWVNQVISAQVINILRNNYTNYSKICLRCPANEGGDLCRIYGKQSSSCALYAKWEKSKKSACDIKMPVSMEYHSQEVFDIPFNSVDIERTGEAIHVKMETMLKPFEYKIYNLLFIEKKSEEEVAKIMNYKTSEKSRAAGYRHIFNVKKKIIATVKKLFADGEIDILG